MGVFIDPADVTDLQLLELFIAYAYLLYIGCTLISDGAELLMLTPYSKLVGAVILPILGAVPDGAIVLFSGLGPDAQTSLDVGVGALAGSTVMLITIPWCLAIYGGRVNLDNDGIPKYAVARGQQRLTPADNLWNCGVTVGDDGYFKVLKMGMWMLFTALPYLIIEISALIAENSNGGITNQQDIDDDQADRLASDENLPALITVIATFFCFCAYLYYQYLQVYGPQPQTHIESKQLSSAVKTVGKRGVGIVAAIRPVLAQRAQAREDPHNACLAFIGMKQSEPETQPLTDDATSADVDATLRAVLTPFFRKYDIDNSKTLSRSELGRVFADMNEPKSTAELESLFSGFDSDKDGTLSFDEFCEGMKQYVLNKPHDYKEGEAIRQRRYSANPSSVPTDDTTEQTQGGGLLSGILGGTKSPLIEKAQPVDDKEAPADFDDDDGDEEEEEIPEEFSEHKFKSVEEQQAAIQNSALKQCLLGTIVVLIFSDPITDVLTEVGTRTGINAFYIGFVVAPLVTNGSELLASYTFALKKTSKSMIVAYEQLLGAAVMNNTYCLFIFIILIYAQALYWSYTAEVISILFAEIMIFCVVFFFKVHTMKTAFFVLSIYPIVIGMVYCLETFVGLS
mmetsp:Transcript_9492/g.11878  ORF Transcript_9492/g.11878 Transcript_9492/m.11878 type:complete len:625 (+) Transcript_9492:49-1923(+)